MQLWYNAFVNKLQYPKLLLLLCTFVASFVLYQADAFAWMEHAFNGRGYISVFLAGLLFSFGFTSAFAVGIFVEIAPDVNAIVAAPLAGLGAFFTDLLIFEIIRFSFFHEELTRLRTTRFFLWLHGILHHERISERIRTYLLWSFAGIVIASPLPDEIGVSLVSGVTNIEMRKFGTLCFLLNTLGILLILLAASAMIT